jgi:hypothetical protein
MNQSPKINYKKFIEENFKVLNKDTGLPVPFKFTWTDTQGITHNIQEKYYEILNNEYGEEMQGIREIVLKARQEGISTFVLALFAADFLLRPYSVSICISHRKDATDILFKKVKFYIQCYLEKLSEKLGIPYEELEKRWMKSDNKSFLENAENHATFYIGTAGAKVGGRGGTATNILFSECAFYQDTELITAQEIVLGTAQQIPQGRGMIFIESTANGEGNYYYNEWNRASEPADRNGNRQSIYRPRFFGWDQFYTEEWVNEKRREFPNDRMWKQEYPKNPEEAFVTSGTPYFDAFMLDAMMKEAPKPVIEGKFDPDGEISRLFENAPVRVYRELSVGEQMVIFADPADSKDFCAAVACSKKHYDFPIVFNEVMDSSQFGYELFYMAKYIYQHTNIWPKLAVERNTGQATIYVLKQLNYPDLFRMVDFSSAGGSYEKGGIGWVTTGHITGGELQGTRRKMLDDLGLALKQGMVSLFDEQQIKQMKSFQIVKGRLQARSQQHDDLVMATAGAWQVHQLTPSMDFGDWDPEEFRKEKEKWRFK